MALMPKRVKHRKSQRGRIRGNATRGNRVVFGEFGLQAMEGGWISAATIEAGRIAAQQYIRGEGKLYIRIFPHKSITSIPLETRMGKGKGEPDYWAAVVRPGTILYEMAGVTEQAAKICFARLAHKMPSPRPDGETIKSERLGHCRTMDDSIEPKQRTPRHERRQLELTLKEAAENLFRLRVQSQTDRLDAPSELRKQRRLIARVKTIMTERAAAMVGQS